MNTGYFLPSVLFRILECIADNALACLSCNNLNCMNCIRIYLLLHTDIKSLCIFAENHNIYILKRSFYGCVGLNRADIGIQRVTLRFLRRCVPLFVVSALLPFDRAAAGGKSLISPFSAAF